MTNSLQARIDALNEDKELKETTEKQLITIESSSALEIFTEQSKLNELIESVKSKIKTIVPDVYSEKGRKEIASMAYSVARTKTYLDSIGKDLVDQYKELPKKIDSGRKFARDRLDLLRDEVREPLTLWEKEQEVIRLKLKIESDHLEAIEMHNEWLKMKAEKLELERLRQAERDRMLEEVGRKLEEERTRREIERLKQEHEKELMAQRQKEIDASLALERAEQRRIQELEAEKQRAAEQARIILEKQKRDEESRQAEEQRKIAEERKRINDENHIKKIRNEIIDDLQTGTRTSAEAESIVCLIEHGLVRHLSINY